MVTYTLLGPRWATSTVTWSFADLHRRPDDDFSATIGAAYRGAVVSAAQRWESVSGLTLRLVDDADNVDIRVGWARFGEGYQIGEARYSYYGDRLQSGVEVLLEDPAERSLFQDAAGVLTYNGVSATLYQVALHEFGHALGLGHSDDPSAVLHPYVQSDNPDLNESDIAGIQALYPSKPVVPEPVAPEPVAPEPVAPSFVMRDAAGREFTSSGEATDGAVDYLQAQYIHAGDAGVSIGAAMANVFIKGGAGDDALAAQSGRNVLDGGRGSNFLVGGSGVDTYFIDGRGGQATWGTVVGFEPGEIITVWGFDPAVSRLRWAESEGTAGYTGRTLHVDMDGDGDSAVLVTIAGADAAAAGRWAVTTGQLETGTYLAVINLT